MLAPLAIAFASAATLADISRRDQTRMMLGQWEVLFAQHGPGWSIQMLNKLSDADYQHLWTAASAFSKYCGSTTPVSTPQEAIEHIKANYEEVVGKTFPHARSIHRRGQPPMRWIDRTKILKITDEELWEIEEWVGGKGETYQAAWRVEPPDGRIMLYPAPSYGIKIL